MKIGVFDSGFGGLNILKSITNKLPQYDYVYLGDSARAPYGSRSQDTVYEYTKQAVEFLIQKDCQLVILACNTASAEALRRIQQEYIVSNHPDRKVLGVIIPAAEQAGVETKNKKVGVIATESTFLSNAFSREIKKIDQEIEVFQKACPLLVPIVETGENEDKILDLILHKYLAEIVEQGIDTLVLGCTHYGIIESHIRRVLDNLRPGIKIINENKIVAEKLENYLARHHDLKDKLSTGSSRKFYSTDITDRFKELGRTFYGEEIEVEMVAFF